MVADVHSLQPFMSPMPGSAHIARAALLNTLALGRAKARFWMQGRRLPPAWALALCAGRQGTKARCRELIAQMSDGRHILHAANPTPHWQGGTNARRRC